MKTLTEKQYLRAQSKQDAKEFAKKSAKDQTKMLEAMKYMLGKPNKWLKIK